MSNSDDVKTLCCDAPIKADPKSTKDWFVPCCSKCGRTDNILSVEDLLKLARRHE